MPSGTMCNVAATLVHCRPGDEILAHETAHIIAREGGAHAALGGFQVTRLPGRRRPVHAGHLSRSAASAHPLPAAADRRQRRADRQYRRRHDLEEGRARRYRRDRKATWHRHPHGRRAAAERLRRHRHQRARHDRGLGFGLDRFLERPRRAGRRGASPARAPSSTRSGAGSSGSAARCARPVSAPPPASTRSTITSTGSPTITPMPARWRAACRRSRAWRCSSPRPIWCSSIRRRRRARRQQMVAELREHGVLLAMMDGRIRACTHLDVSAAMIEETIGLVRDIVRRGLSRAVTSAARRRSAPQIGLDRPRSFGVCAMKTTNMSSFGSIQKNVPPTPSHRYSPSGPALYRQKFRAHRKTVDRTRTRRRGNNNSRAQCRCLARCDPTSSPQRSWRGDNACHPICRRSASSDRTAHSLRSCRPFRRRRIPSGGLPWDR